MDEGGNDGELKGRAVMGAEGGTLGMSSRGSSSWSGRGKLNGGADEGAKEGR